VTHEREAAASAFEDAIAGLETALGKLDAALASPLDGDEAAHVAALERHAQAVSGFSGRQRSFNTAVVNELRQQRIFQRAVAQLIRSQASLLAFLRTIKPYIDTRDLADILRAISDDDLKRSDALLARDRKRELELSAVQTELTEIRARLDELRRSLTP
jgi:hypothetical protein